MRRRDHRPLDRIISPTNSPAKLQGSADVINAEFVLALHFLEAHAAGQAAHDDGHRCARPMYDRLAMTNGRVNRNSIIQVCSLVRSAPTTTKITESFRSVSGSVSTDLHFGP